MDPRLHAQDGAVRGAGHATVPRSIAGGATHGARHDAHERLGFDDLIVQLEPKTTRSLDRLAEALELRTH